MPDQLYINQFSSRDREFPGLSDSSDWIEIYNPNEYDVNLNCWSICDSGNFAVDGNDEVDCTIGGYLDCQEDVYDVIIPAGGFKLVMANDCNDSASGDCDEDEGPPYEDGSGYIHMPYKIGGSDGIRLIAPTDSGAPGGEQVDYYEWSGGHLCSSEDCGFGRLTNGGDWGECRCGDLSTPGEGVGGGQELDPFEQVFINELCTKGTFPWLTPYTFDEDESAWGYWSFDWFELYNPNNFPVNINGWYFQTEEVEDGFTVTEDIFVPAYGYLVFVADDCDDDEVWECHSGDCPKGETGYACSQDYCMCPEDAYEYNISLYRYPVVRMNWGGMGKNDVIYAYDHEGRLVDEVEWKTEDEEENNIHPCEENGSLSRVIDGAGESGNITNDIGTGWECKYGINEITPGKTNEWVMPTCDYPVTPGSVVCYQIPNIDVEMGVCLGDPVTQPGNFSYTDTASMIAAGFEYYLQDLQIPTYCDGMTYIGCFEDSDCPMYTPDRSGTRPRTKLPVRPKAESISRNDRLRRRKTFNKRSK